MPNIRKVTMDLSAEVNIKDKEVTTHDDDPYELHGAGFHPRGQFAMGPKSRMEFYDCSILLLYPMDAVPKLCKGYAGDRSEDRIEVRMPFIDEHGFKTWELSNPAGPAILWLNGPNPVSSKREEYWFAGERFKSLEEMGSIVKMETKQQAQMYASLGFKTYGLYVVQKAFKS